jgi:hypothetical protein
MTGRGQVNPNLVGAPGFDRHFGNELVRSLFRHDHVAERRLARGRGRMEKAEGRIRYGTDRGRHLEPSPIDSTRGECQVAFVDAALAPCSRQDRPRSARTREQDQPGGPPPQAVQRDDGRIVLTDHREQRVLEKATARHRRQAAWLGHAKEFGIFEQHRERTGHVGLFPGWPTPRQALPAPQGLVR